MIYKVKDSIKSFVSYKPNDKEYIIKLDANESSANLGLLKKNIDLSSMQLYPDNRARKLKNAIAKKFNLEGNNVIVGAGSSELLDLVIKTFVNPNDIVLSIEPSFVMFQKYTLISNGVFKSVQAINDSKLQIEGLITASKTYDPSVIFLCTPNNPTGFMIMKEDIVTLLESTNSIVVVDEAYMEFASSNQTVIDLINDYPNLIVNRTFSKAYAIAGARLGYMIANEELIELLYTIKTPYSVNSMSQELGLIALEDSTYLEENVRKVIEERSRLETILTSLNIEFNPSDTNFLYIQFTEYNIAKKLEDKGILIRDFGNSYYRITIGNKIENEILIKELEGIINEN